MTNAEKNALKRNLRLALGKAMRELRGRRRGQATQETLAQGAGMDRSYWGDLERGERNVTLFSLWQMAEALGVKPSRLMLAIDRNYQRIDGADDPPRLTPVQQAIKKVTEFMDQSPEMKWLADTKQGALYCNKPLRDFAGVEHLGGLAWRELFHPDDVKKYVVHSRKKWAAREAYLARYRLRAADGKYKSMVQHAVPYYTPKGVFFGYLGTMILDPENNH